MKAPIRCELKVCFINDAGEIGEASVSLGNGNCPTPEDIREALIKVEDAVDGKGYRLMGKKEFIHHLIEEKTGSTERYAIPGGNKWDAWPDED